MEGPNNAANMALIDALKLNEHSELTKGRQLYLNLYEAICRGLPGQGALLPPSRALAESLGVGRNTVTQVYEQLNLEGLVAARGRSGTRVIFDGAAPSVAQTEAPLSARVSSHSLGTRPRTLSPGAPDAALFPQRDWSRALAQAARGGKDRWGYVRDNGHPALCQSVSRYLAQFRGLSVSPEQIIITAGTRQSLNLAGLMYGSPGDIAWVEEPGYSGAVAAWRAQGLNLHPCPVDEQGMQIPDSPKPRLIYTTPCFHYPLGSTLSPQRRSALLKCAAAHSAVIFEDDYDSEFRDQYQPRPALASESGAAVLHAGTFSKLIFPAVRVAWLVVPATHVDIACRALADIGGGHCSVVQQAVAQLLDQGVVAKHLNRARQVYAQRRKALLRELDQHAPLLSYRDGTGGLSLIVDLQKPVNREELQRQLLAHELGATPLESLCWNGERALMSSAIVLGLGNVPSMEIPQAVQKLRDAVAQSIQ